MIRQFVILSALLAVVSIPTRAQQSLAPIKASDLKHHTLQAGGLDLTIAKLDDYVVVSEDVRDTGVGYLDIRLTNPTNDFLQFVPSKFVIVGRDDNQASIGYERHDLDRVVPQEVSVAPHAKTQMRYNLTARIRFPAVVYYDGKKIARVTS